ncbi:MAG: hypothetical protein GX892_14420 [Thermoanaerobacteraceae bacterium]|nr:hypothetical protein [Thermoanaerobacteraceae bacterium]
MSIKKKSKNNIFFGLHCKDCIQWEEDAMGGGWCPVKRQSMWPGSKICNEFTQ